MLPYRTADRGPDPTIAFGGEKWRAIHVAVAFSFFALTLLGVAGTVAWLTGHLQGGFRVTFYFFFLPYMGIRLLQRARGGTLTFRRDTRELVVTTRRALSSRQTVFPVADLVSVEVVTQQVRQSRREYVLQLTRRSALPLPLVQSPKDEDVQPWEQALTAFLRDYDLLARAPAPPVRVEASPDEAGCDVVVDEAARLHEGVADR